MGRSHQLQALFAGLGMEQGQDVINQVENIDLADLDFQLAGFNLGEIENIIDHCQQTAARLYDRIGVTLGFGRQRLRRQQLCHHHHTIHWRSDFVAHGGQKV